MTASTPSGDAFDIIPLSWLIPSHEVPKTVWPQANVGGTPEVNPTIARAIKAVRDNPTPKANE